MDLDKRLPIYVLTIEPPTGLRRVHCEKLFSKLNLHFNFVNGIKSGNSEVKYIYSKTKNIFFSKRNLTTSEIACYFGFRKIWQAFLDTGQPVCLIAEDDINIINEDDFKNVIIHAQDNAAWDILKLFDFKPKKILNRESWNSLTIADYKYPSSGCVAYLITRKAAQKLLLRKKIYRAVDEDFSHCWEFGLRVRSVSPNPVTENSDGLGGSYIEKDRLLEKGSVYMVRSIWGIFLQMRKQILGFFYRRKLASHQKIV